MPIPIQSGSMSDRLRKFFRIRGRTDFVLDEVVAPVVIVQDLTEGPYIAGVTPAAGTIQLTATAGNPWAIAWLLNDKPGSLTPVLDRQFNDRSFSFTFGEIQNVNFAIAGDLANLRLLLTTRALVVAAGVPTVAETLTSIQNNDGSVSVPVEAFMFNSVTIAGTNLWKGLLGDNTNTIGSRRTLDAIKPSLTIGPTDALVLTTGIVSTGVGELFANVRGFYQEQPA